MQERPPHPPNGKNPLTQPKIFCQWSIRQLWKGVVFIKPKLYTTPIVLNQYTYFLHLLLMLLHAKDTVFGITCMFSSVALRLWCRQTDNFYACSCTSRGKPQQVATDVTSGFFILWGIPDLNGWAPLMSNFL